MFEGQGHKSEFMAMGGNVAKVVDATVIDGFLLYVCSSHGFH